MRELVLYHTLGCHLCEQAQALLEPLARAHGWRVELVDIADDDAVFERYSTRIPVVRDAPGGTELGWPFDREALLRAFG